MTTVFLFAHQDDEIGVMSALRSAAADDAALCVYLTNGVWAGVASATRDAESRKVLNALGVKPHFIHTVGSQLDIPDGRLVEHLDRVLDAVSNIVATAHANRPVKRIVTHAWEGGHQDHDAGHLIGLALAHQFDVMSESRQYGLYRRAPQGRKILFASPMPENGPVETTPIPFSTRIQNLRLLTAYRSQARVIARLLPLILGDYIKHGAQRLQPLSIARVHEHPNTPPMLYETWNMFSYARFVKLAQPFIARHIASGEPASHASGPAT